MSADEMMTWLRAQIEADKAAALAVRDNSAPWDGQWQPRGRHALETYNGWVLAVAGPSGGDFRPGVVEHIAIHDPQDTIARCEAEMAIIAEYEAARIVMEVARNEPDGIGSGVWACFKALKRAVRLLGCGYRFRGGYRKEWAP